jgi:type II secretory pathway pseudopilin PulG
MLVLTAAILPPAASASKDAQIQTLKRQNSKLINQRAQVLKRASKRGGELERVHAQLSSAKEEVRQLSTQATRASELEAALAAGLPAQITAVPLSSFRDLVLRPAFDAYPAGCRGFTSTSGSWLYSFYSPELC